MPNFLLGGGNVGRAQDFQGQMAEFLRTTEGFRRNQTQLAIEQEEAKKLQQMNEQAAKDAKEWHPDAVLAVIPAHLRPIYKQVLERSGMINPNGTVLGKDARTLNEQFYKHPDLQFQAGELEVAELQKQVDKAKTPEDRDAAIERLNALRLWQKAIKDQMEKKGEDKPIPVTEKTTGFYQGGKFIRVPEDMRGESDLPYKVGQQVDKIPDPSGSGALGVATFGGIDPSGNPIWKNWTVNRGAQSGNQEIAEDLARLEQTVGKRLDPKKSIVAQLPPNTPASIVQEARRIEHYTSLQTVGTPAILGYSPQGSPVVATRNVGGGSISGDYRSPLIPRNMGRTPGEFANEVGMTQSIVQDAQAIKEEYKQLWDHIGPVANRAKEVIQIIDNDPAYETFRSRVKGLIRVAYAWSGKQISEREMAILSKAILPDGTQMGQNFLAKVNYLEDLTGRIVKNKADAFSKQQYYVDPTLTSWIKGNKGTEQPAPSSGTKSFKTEADAEAAAKRGDIKPGDKITVGGRSATWR